MKWAQLALEAAKLEANSSSGKAAEHLELLPVELHWPFQFEIERPLTRGAN